MLPTELADTNKLARVRIVLVEPAGALNVGSIARVMKNLGLSDWVLVNPHCEVLGAEARQMAVHAGDVLESVRIVNSLPEALQNCHRAIATTARPRALNTTLEHPRTALPWLLESSEEQTIGALIFGPEDRGLSNDELSYAQRFVCIPSQPAYPALNLAQAVAICCYELSQLSPPSSPPPSQPASPAPIDSLEAYYRHLEALLLQVGYLYPHTASSRMQKVRRLFNRALPAEAEVAMLRGMLTQIEWALRQSTKEPFKEKQGSSLEQVLLNNPEGE
ncbi:MAG TPA: RNA methyltransferase, partial [Thermosynechococcaceae cyanobacterium]